jgi:hypothetical protein
MNGYGCHIAALPPPWELIWRGFSAPAGLMLRLWLGQLRWTEHQVLALLKSRLDDLDRTADRERSDEGRAAAVGDDLAATMEALLRRSLAQSTAAGRYELFRTLLAQLLPDEARIMAALGDGSTSPLVHVETRSLAPGPGTPLLENASLVGRTAAVTIPQLTPTYVSHLQSLGLVESGPEDPGLAEEYEVLMAEAVVREALTRGAQNGFFPPRTVRRTLRLSPLGRQLWEACKQSESQ